MRPKYVIRVITEKQNMNMLVKTMELPNKGIGMIALTDIQPETTLIVEKPVISWKKYDPLNTLSSVTSTQRQSLDILSPYNLQSLPSNIVSQARTLLASGNLDSDDETIRTYFIIETNAFPRGIMLDISRCNHSCVPNAKVVEVENDESEVAYILQSIKDITKGEEVCISYLEEPESQICTDRQRRLNAQYFFECNCQRCVDDLQGSSESRERVLCWSCLKGTIFPQEGICNSCNAKHKDNHLSKVSDKLHGLKVKINCVSSKTDADLIRLKLSKLVPANHVLLQALEVKMKHRIQ